MINRLTLAEFEERAIAKHGNKYDYSLAKYVNAKTKIIIICPIHGRFEQIPDDHVRGKGCKDCGMISTSKSITLSVTEFIKMGESVHGIFYDYSKANYVKSSMPVVIVCPVHGEFSQSPSAHLSGKGCRGCGLIKSINARKGSSEIFIKKAQIVHPGLYDYHLAEYVNSCSKVKIICKEHGIFLQSPNGHVRGKGCPKCGIHSGADHPNWKKEKTDEERAKHRDDSAACRAWRKAILNGDDYTCQKCQTKGGKLQAHHILLWSKFPESRFDISNGAALCTTCHNKYHRMYGYKAENCNQKTFNHYLKTLDPCEDPH